MDNGDISATILASLALLVSIFTLYLTFLHKRAKLIGCLAAIDFPAPSYSPFCTFDFALSNTGTLELLLREVALDVSGPYTGLLPETNPEDMPIVIGPGQVKLIKVQIPNLFIRNLAQRGGSIEFDFHIFSSRGNLYLARKLVAPLDESLELPKSTWSPFSLGKVET